MTTIPWVAMWSGEREYQGPMALGPRGIAIPPADYQGVHWIPFLNAPGVGTPLFGQVHTMRQIKSMRGPRCQVCGIKMDKRAATWVLNGETDPVPDGRPVMTMTPPTCEACIPIARVECPHVAKLDPLRVLHVTSYRVVGVFGDFFVPGMGGQPIGQVAIEFGDDKMNWLLGRQLIVRLMDYAIQDSETTPNRSKVKQS